MSFTPSFDAGPGLEMDEREFSRAPSRRTVGTNRISAQPSIQLRAPRPPSSVYSRSISAPQDGQSRSPTMPGPEDKDSRFIDGWMHPAIRRTTVSSIGSYSGLVRLPSEDEGHSDRRPSEPDTSITTVGTSSERDKSISQAGSHRCRQLSSSAAEQGQVSSGTAPRRKWSKITNIAIAILSVAVAAILIVIVLAVTGKIGKAGVSTASASATATAEQSSRTRTSSLVTSRETGDLSSIDTDTTAEYHSIPTLPPLSSAPIATSPAADNVEIYKIPTITTTQPLETAPPSHPPLSGLYPPLSQIYSPATVTTKQGIEELLPGFRPGAAGRGLLVG